MKRNFAAFAAAVALASCGGDGGSSGPIGATPALTPTPTPTPPPAPTPTPPPVATAPQVSLSYLHVFGVTEADGSQPNGPLVQASDGNFYGTTGAGGRNRCNDLDNFCGAIIRLTPSGQESVLYSFSAATTDAYRPSGALIEGRDGALYGLASSGGAYGSGAVYRITLGGSFSILYSFGATAGDGIVPTGALVQGTDGDFYGTTASGGVNNCRQIPQAGGNCGTVFKVSASGVERVLYSFGTSQADGVTPNGSLLQASDGNFYGTTVNGGANACSSTNETNNCGTIFRITQGGQASILYSFGQSTSDGIAPQGSLIQGADGILYGTTVSGGGGRCGGQFGCGTVFRITTSGDLSIVYRFALDSRSDGYGPSPQIIQARDGNFYGTTISGGATSADRSGTVFRLTSSAVKTILYSFGPLTENPSAPVGGVVQGQDGSFYGVLAENGNFGGVGARRGSGAVFKIDVN